MDFERFKEWAIKDISSRLPEEYDDAELFFEEIKKFGGSYTGLSLRKPGRTVSPTVNMEQFYGFYLNGVEIGELGRVMAGMLQYRMDTGKMDLDWIGDYEKAKKHFYLCLSNAEKRADYLEGVPYIVRADLALTCHIMTEIPGEGYAGTIVNDLLLRDYGVGTDKLFKDALENSIGLMPPKLEFAHDIYDKEVDKDEDDPFYNMLIISNESHFRGAAVLFYPGILEEAAMKLGGNYYVLPSSVHEVLAIPADPKLSVCDLSELVMEANLMHVPEEEQLSDNVYYYDVNTGEFMLANTDDRMMC